MRISFICNYIYLNGGWSPWDKRIGGSEEFIVEVSKRLVKLGHEVTVFHNGQHGVYEGVEYRSHDDFTAGDITININFPEFKCDGKQVFWTSLDKHPNLSHFEAVCYISEYQRNNCGIEHKNLFWVPPGYDETKIYPGTKIPKQCLYASSPDRGLETLLRAWPKVHESHPDATLIVTYGAQEYDLPNVTFIDATNEEMDELYRTSDIWCHPANGGELYCITGVKAQAAGCVPVIIPVMALHETVKHGFFSTGGINNYIKFLNYALSGAKETERGEMSKEHYPTWDTSTDRLMEIINSVIV